MNNKGSIIIKQIFLIFINIIIAGLICMLIILKLKSNNEDPINNEPLEEKDKNNYVELYDLKEEIKKYQEIEFNKKTVINDITLYGLESLKINKIGIENGKIKYYTSDNKTYIDNYLGYNVKYIEYSNKCDEYSELLIYTTGGVYYYNTNGNPEIVDQTLAESYYKNSKEYAKYVLNGNYLNLNFIKLTDGYKVTGIATLNEVNYDSECKSTYFVVKTTTGVLKLNYIKTTSNGINIISSVKLGNSLAKTIDYISYIKNEKPLFINYDLSVKDKEGAIFTDLGKTIIASKIFVTKDSYYIVSTTNDIYKLSIKENNEIKKYNEKEVEKVILEEERSYQGQSMLFIKQYIKIIYIDGTTEEIL